MDDGAKPAVAGLEQIAVVARAALEPIAALPALEHVAPIAAEQVIVTGIAHEPVRAARADQMVGTGRAVQARPRSDRLRADRHAPAKVDAAGGSMPRQAQVRGPRLAPCSSLMVRRPAPVSIPTKAPS